MCVAQLAAHPEGVPPGEAHAAGPFGHDGSAAALCQGSGHRERRRGETTDTDRPAGEASIVRRQCGQAPVSSRQTPGNLDARLRTDLSQVLHRPESAAQGGRLPVEHMGLARQPSAHRRAAGGDCRADRRGRGVASRGARPLAGHRRRRLRMSVCRRAAIGSSTEGAP